MLESAIPASLQEERTVPAKTPVNYDPPFPAYTARLPQTMKDIVMAVIGAQYERAKANGKEAMLKVIEFVKTGSLACRPTYWEPASVTDNAGAYNEVIIAYWPSKASYLEWTSQSGFEMWWRELDPDTEPHGWFQEVFFPPIERMETVFSSNKVPEGAAYLKEEISGPILEHVYWGSMRDRLPIGQTDELSGEKLSPPVESRSSHDEDDGKASKTATITPTTRQRIHVPGRKNLTVIRSGQDWSSTPANERTLYTNTMHPVLIAGMDYLRDHGRTIGCYSCRFMDVLDPNPRGGSTSKTFGLAYFDSLASLERWSREHKTHLDIFQGFLQYTKALEHNISLRLFHEVLVLTPEQQYFEYVGCHVGTGMLGLSNS